MDIVLAQICQQVPENFHYDIAEHQYVSECGFKTLSIEKVSKDFFEGVGCVKITYSIKFSKGRSISLNSVVVDGVDITGTEILDLIRRMAQMRKKLITGLTDDELNRL